MSLTTRVAAHIPYLRRYARAVTGSQTSGDAYVAAVLEALIADLSIYPEASSDRVALYKLFVTIFGSTHIEIRSIASPFAWENRAASNLLAVPPRERHAFLLISVEGFTYEEAAEILGVDDAEFRALFNQASVEISRQVATDIMIIEDEPLIALDIEQMVEDLGHRVTGIARTHKEAVELYGRTNPKMVLADIQLADGSSGIDAINDILKVDTVPVIFITAFPERLLTGERPEPAFLVTKPFNPDMVKALISQALFFNERAHQEA
ncbi:response regulator [Allorhizobium taibaishanense]|uniref:DNA-directed RNA polymerase specialized sigma24 family protein n=1 Tax=Allorhizobium taibaishanense TaxID=887144 RepID=A0A1Q9ABM3_9HYPH|nr:response regulator [Allorhizobium taibaishanense]MBB4010640.1 DNA-directed RNA polymerase specialized sigma24 family protein [Allorhizobium taibaishanense]OLP52263.1 two-component response regulator [Allorhizobium taibaishanense]